MSLQPFQSPINYLFRLLKCKAELRVLKVEDGGGGIKPHLRGREGGEDSLTPVETRRRREALLTELSEGSEIKYLQCVLAKSAVYPHSDTHRRPSTPTVGLFLPVTCRHSQVFPLKHRAEPPFIKQQGVFPLHPCQVPLEGK